MQCWAYRHILLRVIVLICLHELHVDKDPQNCNAYDLQETGHKDKELLASSLNHKLLSYTMSNDLHLSHNRRR